MVGASEVIQAGRQSPCKGGDVVVTPVSVVSPLPIDVAVSVSAGHTIFDEGTTSPSTLQAVRGMGQSLVAQVLSRTLTGRTRTDPPSRLCCFAHPTMTTCHPRSHIQSLSGHWAEDIGLAGTPRRQGMSVRAFRMQFLRSVYDAVSLPCRLHRDVPPT